MIIFRELWSESKKIFGLNRFVNIGSIQILLDNIKIFFQEGFIQTKLKDVVGG